MEERNKKKRLLYTILGVIVLLASVGGAYAFFSASISNTGNILGQTQSINNNSLRLSVTKVNFNGIDTNVIPSNDLVPAFFGTTNNSLTVSNPSQLDITNVQDMIESKCVNTSEGYTGCHVWKIAISADQNIAHVNLLLGLTVNDHSTSDVSVVDKSQWGYVVFTASQNSSSTGVVGSGTQTAIADGLTTNLALNSAGHGAPAAIGDGLVSSPTDNRIDIHNNQKLIGCNSAGAPQEVVYYLLVYVNDTDVSQNTSTNGEGDSNYAVGSYSGTLELQALGGIVRADFGPSVPEGTLKSRAVPTSYNISDYSLGLIFGNEEDGYYGIENGTFGEELSPQMIANIYTVNHTSIPQNAVHYWDASEEQNGSVMAWVTVAGEPNDDNYCEFISYDRSDMENTMYTSVGSKGECDEDIAYYNASYDEEFDCGKGHNCISKKLYTYNLFIGQVGGVKAPSNSAYLFANFMNAEEIDVSNLDTSNATNMYGMFFFYIDYYVLDPLISPLTELDLSNFNTSIVTNMSYMFADCYNLATLDISSFDTSNVTNMENMFYGCNNLATLDLSNFDFNGITVTVDNYGYRNSTMDNMFDAMGSLTSITSKVADETLICDTITHGNYTGVDTPVSINNGSRECSGSIPVVH